MSPDPQDALPLPLRPDVGQYRKLAKELVKACASREPGAIGDWVDRWLDSLARALGEARPEGASHWDRKADDIEAFAKGKLLAGERPCVLADAQFVLARAHGFESWPKFAAHLDALAHRSTEEAAFEAAADAVVEGDEAELRRLLAEQPGLIRQRSTREHRATLLHYVSANGVEGWRQETPPNAVAIARILLDGGAEVDAEADMYGGGSTTLGLVATSAHPRGAGVQIPLLELLLAHGARMEHPNLAGNDHSAVMACIANGCPEAAAYLAERGAWLDFVTAAAVGRFDLVRAHVERTSEGVTATQAQLEAALRYACMHGHTEIARYLMQKGADPAHHGRNGQTALHYAAIGGQVETLRMLLERDDPPLEARNEYGGTVLGQALWSAAHGGDPDDYVAIIDALVAAGAQVLERHPPVNAKVDAALARHGSVADPEDYWFGERPRRRRPPAAPAAGDE